MELTDTLLPNHAFVPVKIPFDLLPHPAYLLRFFTNAFLYCSRPGLLSAIFEVLYDEEIVSDDSFFTWEISEEEPQGKDVALHSIWGFLQWLKEAEEESMADTDGFRFIY